MAPRLGNRSRDDVPIDGTTPSMRAAPHFGEHNEEVLTSLLGLSQDDLRTLIADGVLF